MPVPLIAAAIIGIGAVTGSSGVALGGKGMYDIAGARRRLKEAQESYAVRRGEVERDLAHTNASLKALGETQKTAIEDVVVRMGEFLRRNERQVRESERLLVDGVDATTTQISGLTGLDVDAVAWIGGVWTSAATGAGVGAGVTSAVSTFGIASTGAAISGLSGAAAESATLAALGGGSLAAGGGGMALGATALNFVTIGPALLVGGMVVKGQGTRARTQAEAFEAEIQVSLAELDQTEQNLTTVSDRVKELKGILVRLTALATDALDRLESEPFDPARHAGRFQEAMMLVMAVRDVAATPVVNSSGSLNERVGDLVIRYQPMLKEHSND